MNRGASRRLRRRLIDTALILGLLALATGILTGWSPGAQSGVALLTAGAFAQAVENILAPREPTGPQVPLDNHPPLWRRVLAGLFGVNLNRHDHTP